VAYAHFVLDDFEICRVIGDFTLLNVPEIIKKSGRPWEQMLEDRQDVLSHGIDE
jgi:hypothetical protein